MKHFRVVQEGDDYWVYRRTMLGLWSPVACHSKEASAVRHAEELFAWNNMPKVRRVVFTTTEGR